jgi:replicative DNA helicase
MAAGGLSAGAGTRKLEYAAETVIELQREADAKENAYREIPITLKIAKNRHGAPGPKVELLFNGALQQFREA